VTSKRGGPAVWGISAIAVAALCSGLSVSRALGDSGSRPKWYVPPTGATGLSLHQSAFAIEHGILFDLLAPGARITSVTVVLKVPDADKVLHNGLLRNEPGATAWIVRFHGAPRHHGLLMPGVQSTGAVNGYYVIVDKSGSVVESKV
jgi:hypothetical protein